MLTRRKRNATRTTHIHNAPKDQKRNELFVYSFFFSRSFGVGNVTMLAIQKEDLNLHVN